MLFSSTLHNMLRHDGPCDGLSARKAKNLRRLRERSNLKQWQIAEVLDVKENVVSDMERCKRTITDRTIEALCNKYGWDFEEFFILEQSEILTTEKERAVVKAMRSYPLLQEQLFTISEALKEQYRGESGEGEGSAVPGGRKKGTGEQDKKKSA